MVRRNKITRRLCRVSAALLCLQLASISRAYVDTAPGLAEIVSESQSICLVEITEFDRENHTITYKPVRALKGDLAPGPIQHQVAAAGAPSIPTAISQWAAPGLQAVLFSSKTIGLVCIGGSWYSVNLLNNTWKFGNDRPDLPLAYCGTISRLADAVQKLAAGQDAIATVVSYGADDAGTAFDLAFHRTNLPGLVRLDRVHLSPNVLGTIGRVSSMPGYVLGAGPVDETDLPALIEKLASKDATASAEAAEDIGVLKSQAKSAIGKLTELLRDAEPRVRFAAAGALLRIVPATPAAVEVLRQGLNSPETFSGAMRPSRGHCRCGRRAARRITRRPSQRSRSTYAIRSTTVHRQPRTSRCRRRQRAVRPLLDDPTVQCDAADALGRIGVAARPISDTLLKMLASPDESTQWAAIRAMSQIGGKESHPAVEFMIKKIPTATVTEGYDIRIYLAMLGPDAIDALPALQASQLRNGKLSLATEWAIESNQYLPWTNEPGMAGQPGGVKVIYDAYINNLGTRLAPAARLMANKMMDGTVGTVPIWGYRLLTCAPDEALKIFTPHLADNTQQMRERAIVGLGYMGPLAAPARELLKTALQNATDEREKLLLAWSLRQINPEN